MPRFLLFALTGLFFLLPALPEQARAAQTNPAQTEQRAPLPVIVSIAPQKYLLERIAGKAVSVTVLVKPGADPHSYEPSPAQMRACASASLYFTIGVPFEEIWLPRIAGAAPNLTVVSTIKDIQRLRYSDDALLLADMHLARPDGKESKKQPAGTPLPGEPVATHNSHPGEKSPGDEAKHEHEGFDPHVWLSPMLVRQMLPGMARELGKAIPEKAAEFRAAAQRLSDELEALDARLAEKFSAFPRGKRIFLTFHPSWRYYAHNYELTALSIEVEGKEPGPRAMKTIIDTAREHGVHTVFVEPQFPRAAAEAIAASLDANIVVADPLAEDLPGIYTGMAEKLAAAFAQ